VVDIARSVVKQLRAADVEVALPPDEAHAFEGIDIGPVVDADPDHPTTGAELVVVLGGDGTILRGAEHSRGTKVPLLGVNLGHVGFLAEAEREEIPAMVDHIVHRAYEVEERMTLAVTVRQEGAEPYPCWALNEVSVEKAARERMLEVAVEVDGKPLSAFGCDGVVVATPTGSTAYAFSLGGPVIWPDVEAILMVPNAAHALFSRPIVVGPRLPTGGRGHSAGRGPRHHVVRRAPAAGAPPGVADRGRPQRCAGAARPAQRVAVH
jgi:NAD+ kinase